jgi:hypothetical protein
MTNKILPILLLFSALFLLPACNNSTEPTENGETTISVSGDIAESYNAVAYFGISTYTTDSEEKEYFTIMIIPMESENPLAMTLLYKSGPEAAQTGNYQIGKYAFGNDIPAGWFGGNFSSKDAIDFSGYTMTSGNLTITKSTAESIQGSFNMNGHYVQFVEEDSSRTITVTGEFNAIPMPEVNP